MAIIEVSTISEEPPLWLRNFTNSDGFYLFPAPLAVWRGSGTVLVLELDGFLLVVSASFFFTLKKYENHMTTIYHIYIYFKYKSL